MEKTGQSTPIRNSFVVKQCIQPKVGGKITFLVNPNHYFQFSPNGNDIDIYIYICLINVSTAFLFEHKFCQLWRFLDL